MTGGASPSECSRIPMFRLEKAIAIITAGLIRSEIIVMQNRATPFSGADCALHFTP